MLLFKVERGSIALKQAELQAKRKEDEILELRSRVSSFLEVAQLLYTYRIYPSNQLVVRPTDREV